MRLLSGAWGRWGPVWLWAALIFCSIGLARTMQAWVDTHVGRDAFLIPVGIAIVLGLGWSLRRLLRSIRTHRFLRLLLLVACSGVFCGWTWHLRSNPEEALHFIEYGVLSLLAFRAYRGSSNTASLAGVHAMLFCLQVGAMDEVIQWLVPERYFDFRDILLNAGSAVLVMVAVRWGLGVRSDETSGRPQWLHLHGQVGRVLFIFLCLVNLTPAGLYSLSAFHPVFETLARNRSVVAEYGYEHSLDGIGVMKSRLTLEDLSRYDRAFAAESAAIVNAYPDAGHYSRFLGDWPSGRNAFVHEFRVHVFSRDYHRHRTWSGKKEELGETAYRDHVRTAVFENRILNRVFPLTQAQSRFSLENGEAGRLENLYDFEPDFVSKVSQNLMTRLNQIQMNGLLIAAGLVWFAVRMRLRAA